MREEVAEYSYFLRNSNGHTGLNNFPGMAMAELWIDCRLLENLFCMRLDRMSITQGGGKNDLSATIYWNWRKRTVKAMSRFCLPTPMISLAVDGNTIQHCFLCCVPAVCQVQLG